jgi:hypothetical protein
VVVGINRDGRVLLGEAPMDAPMSSRRASDEIRDERSDR